MGHRWFFLLSALVAVLLLLGCGTSSSSNSGVTEAEIAKMMEDAKAEAAKLPAFETPAEEMVDLLTSDPSSAGPAEQGLAGIKQGLVGKRRIITGVVVDRSPEMSDSPFLMLDGGTHNSKAYKVKFNFTDGNREELKAVTIGDSVRVEGISDGELKDDTLEFKECVLNPVNQPASTGSDGAGEKPGPKP
jgi:hypothetical protein